MTTPREDAIATLREDAALLHSFVHPGTTFEDCDGARCVRRRKLLAALAAESRPDPVTPEHESWCYRKHTGHCVDGPSDPVTPEPER